MATLSLTSSVSHRRMLQMIWAIGLLLLAYLSTESSAATTSTNVWGIGRHGHTDNWATEPTKKKKKKSKKQATPRSDSTVEEERPFLESKRKRKAKASLGSPRLDTEKQLSSSKAGKLSKKRRKKTIKKSKVIQREDVDEATDMLKEPESHSRPSLHKSARKPKKKTKKKRKSTSSVKSARDPEPGPESEDGIKPAKRRRKASKKRKRSKADISDGTFKLSETMTSTTADEPRSPELDLRSDSSSSVSPDTHNAKSQDVVEDSSEFQIDSPDQTAASYDESFEASEQIGENQTTPVDSSVMDIATDDLPADPTAEQSEEALSLATEGNESPNMETDVSVDNMLEDQTHEENEDTSRESKQTDVKDVDTANGDAADKPTDIPDKFTGEEEKETETINGSDLLTNEERNDKLDMDSKSADSNMVPAGSTHLNNENVNDETDRNNTHDQMGGSIVWISEEPSINLDGDNDSDDTGEGDDATNAESFSTVNNAVSNNIDSPVALDLENKEEDGSIEAQTELSSEQEETENSTDDTQKESLAENKDSEDNVEDDTEKEILSENKDSEEEEEEDDHPEENAEIGDEDQPNACTSSNENESDRENDAEPSSGSNASTTAASIMGDSDEQRVSDLFENRETDEIPTTEITEQDEMVAAKEQEEDDDDDKGQGGAKLKSDSEIASDTNIDLVESVEKENTTASLSSRSESTVSSSDDTGTSEGTISIQAMETLCDDPSDLTCSIVTWNLAEESPAEEEAAFFQQFRGHDMVLISGQECENIKPRRTEGRRSREYRRLMIKYLGSEYVPIALHMLGGIQFGLFCKRSILKDVESVSVADVTCGIGNVFHNKGAIAAFVTLRNTGQSLRLLFVTAHMAAHVKNTEARNADFWRIVSELQAQAPARFLAPRSPGIECTGEYLLDSADRIFFCGDLNYRIDLPREFVEHTIREAKDQFDPEAREKLLRHDQLRAAIAEGSAFPGFAEGKLSFAPTFKFDKGTQDYDTSHKQRIPAWTDRVLFKPRGTRVLAYDSVPLSTHSDHRPVFASFRLNRTGKSETKPKRKKRKKHVTE